MNAEGMPIKRKSQTGRPHLGQKNAGSTGPTGPSSGTVACGELALIRVENEVIHSGPISAAVADDLARLTPRLDKPDASLMALALTLARTLDDGAGMATAAVSKELRATLSQLTPEEHHDDDGFTALIEQLRA